MELIAKPIVKNKFWIVEESGKQIATIQAIEEGGFVYVHDNEREKFPTIKVLSHQHNINFDKSKPAKVKPEVYEVYGYPSSFRTYNEIFDVQRKLPIFTKTAKSKSFFCAGHYLIKFSNTWVRAFCPKAITLNRYEYLGPFKTVEEMSAKLKEQNGN
jgi:hypothetical protein